MECKHLNKGKCFYKSLNHQICQNQLSHKSASLLLTVSELLAKACIIHKGRPAMLMPFRAPTLHSSHLLDEVRLTYSKG